MKKVVIIEDERQIAKLMRESINKSSKYSCDKIYLGPMLFLASSDKADIVLLDIVMPDMNGITAIPLIKKKLPNAAIIMNTIKDDTETIFESLKLGAVGYIDKQSFDQNFEDVFNDVENGGGYMTPKIARKVIQYFQKPMSALQKLSPREKEITTEILNGLSYKMVGDKLGITLDTVRMNIKHIYKKLDINSKGELFKLMKE